MAWSEIIIDMKSCIKMLGAKTKKMLMEAIKIMTLKTSKIPF